MPMPGRARIAAGLLIGSVLPVAAADTPAFHALQGYSGLLTIPDAAVTAERQVDLQFNTDRDTDADSRLDAVHNYALSIGVWHGLELGGRVSEGMPAGRRDLSGSLKLRLLHWRGLSLALGFADFAGNAQHLRARYLSAHWQQGRWRGVLGVGDGPDRLNGPFGGLRYDLNRHVSLLADHDGNAVHGGLRAQWAVTGGLSVYGLLKASNDPRQSASAAIGLRLDLGARQPLRPDSAAVVAGRDGLRAGRVDSTDTPVDSLRAVRRRLATAEAHSPLIEYRYGVPLRRFDADDPLRAAGDAQGQVASRWQAQQRDLRSAWEGTPRSIELRLWPDLRHATATEVGLYDYSLALQPSLRAQGPLGLGLYLTADLPLARSDDAEPGGAFSHFRHDGGLHQAALQWAAHPLAGLIGLNTLGRTEVDEVPYDMLHLDWALHDSSGRHQLRLAWAEYRAVDDLNFADRRTRVVGYRHWWTAAELALRVDWGEFFFGDRGSRLQLDRYFGNVVVSLLYRRRENGEQDGGMQFSFPLTGEPLRWGRLRITGAPSWPYRLISTIDGPDGRNVVRRGFLVEPLPTYTLQRDLLDADRAFPAYASDPGPDP